MTLYTVTDDYHGGVLEFDSASELALALSENMPGYIWLIIGEPDNAVKFARLSWTENRRLIISLTTS